MIKLREHWRGATLALGLVGLVSLPVVGYGKPGGRHFGHRGGPPPIEKLLEKHADQLGLDEATQAQITQLVEASRSQREVLREASQREREVLRELLAADTPNTDAVMEQIDVLGSLRTSLRKERLRSWLEVRALLTPEQRQQLREMRSERREKFREHMKRRRGEPDAPPAPDAGA